MIRLVSLLMALSVGLLASPGCSMLGLDKKEAKQEEKPEEERKAEEMKQPKPEEPKVEELPKVEEKPEEEPQPEVATITLDHELGAKRLARLWNEIEIPQLLEIVADWKDADLVPVLAKMDNSKVAELFASLEPERSRH